MQLNSSIGYKTSKGRVILCILEKPLRLDSEISSFHFEGLGPRALVVVKVQKFYPRATFSINNN